MKRFLVLGAALAAFSLSGTSATAATVCSGGSLDPTQRVSDGAGGYFSCEFVVNVANSGSGAYDNLFFGGGFTEIVRDADSDLGAGGLTTGNTTSGTFSVAASIASIYDSFVLVFKAGSGNNTLPGEAVAFFIDDTLTGSYLTPLASSSGKKCSIFPTFEDCPRDISHVALLGKVSDDPNPVPLPAAGWMLLAGIAGLGAWGRRRTQV